MSDYAHKLSALALKKQKLQDEETKLIEKRKFDIALLAEKFELLTASDALIHGLFADAQAAINNKTDKVKSWETLGGRFLKNKVIDSKSITTDQKPATVLP